MQVTPLTPDVRGNYGGARLVINGRRCSLSSVRRYAEYNNLVYGEARDIEAQVARAKELGHPLVWINLESTVVCADPGYYEREEAKWASAPRIMTGDFVEFDGEVFKVEPTHNGNFQLVARKP